MRIFLCLRVRLRAVGPALPAPGRRTAGGSGCRRRPRGGTTSPSTTLADRDDPTRGRSAGDARQHLDVRPGLLDPRRADEDAVHRAVDAVEVEVALERVDLAPERVAPHGDVEARRRSPGRRCRPRSGRRAGSSRRRCRSTGMPAWIRSGAARSARTCGPAWPWWSTRRRGGPARRRRRARSGGGPARAHAQPLERRQVLAHVALQGEHADGGHGSILWPGHDSRSLATRTASSRAPHGSRSSVTGPWSVNSMSASSSAVGQSGAPSWLGSPVFAKLTQ